MTNQNRNITVTVLPPNSRPIEVNVPAGSTVQDVLRQGGVSLAKAQAIRIGGESVALDAVVEDQQTLSIAPEVVGG